jgi:two-component system, OmpR family, response regulator
VSSVLIRILFPPGRIAETTTLERRDERLITETFIDRSWKLGTIGRVRVLIVEDELRMASLIRRGLVKEGLAADVAASGEEALVSAGAHGSDAIVLDVVLPGLNGFEIFRRLRRPECGRPC